MIQVSSFKFTLDWETLENVSSASRLNPQAVNFYHSVINQLHSDGVEPHVTLFEKGLPASIKVCII